MKDCGHPLCSVAPADWFNSHGSAHGHYLCEGCAGDWNRLWGTEDNQFSQVTPEPPKDPWKSEPSDCFTIDLTQII
jgi:hypothetical protein